MTRKILDAVDNVCPSHYEIKGLGQETIEVIECVVRQNAISAWEGAMLKDVLKYLFRYRSKGGLKDLYKAKDYLNWLINEVENEI